MVVGGRERSVSQYEELLQQADLSMAVVTPLPSGYVLIKAMASSPTAAPGRHVTSVT